MMILLLLGCVAGGIAIYHVIVRPFMIPLTKRIPNGREYRASLGVPRK